MDNIEVQSHWHFNILSWFALFSAHVCAMARFFPSARVKKLRETLVAMQQLDKNMSSLRSWLAHIETELSRPIVYDACDDKEIQKKLSQQQASGGCAASPPEIQRDGVSCDVERAGIHFACHSRATTTADAQCSFVSCDIAKKLTDSS